MHNGSKEVVGPDFASAGAYRLSHAAHGAPAISGRTNPRGTQMSDIESFVKISLVTGDDGRAVFREESIALDHGTPQSRLSALMASGGLQLRASPVGFRSEFHCTGSPQWVFILGGRMEIGLQDGSTRVFEPGMHFHSADTLPAGAVFDPALHGHRSRQLGDEPLVTLFVRA